MQLKEFQEQILDKLEYYLKILSNEYLKEKREIDVLKGGGEHGEFDDKRPKRYCEEAWKHLIQENKIPSIEAEEVIGARGLLPYIERKNGIGEVVPNVCLNVPTGGGKTLLGVSAIEQINGDYFRRNTGLILWVVPTDAIYQQTIKNFKDRNHSYRKVLERASGNRVKLLQKNEAFSRFDLQNYLCVMVIMLQAVNRETKEFLRVFKDSGRFISLFPQPDNEMANQSLLKSTPNLCVYEKSPWLLGGQEGISVKHSLGNAIRMSRPIVVLDEGHKVYSTLARKTIYGLNPKFVLELSATPDSRLSNILVSASGTQLKKEEMIKLPINAFTSETVGWKNSLWQSYEKLKELEQEARVYEKKSQKYIRPIMLIQVERTGKDQRGKGTIHAEDVRECLIEKMGVPEKAIRVKASGQDELKEEDLLSYKSPVQFIITKQALQEGWDCPFAYVLTILSNARSKKALTQLIGRILRQPYAQETSQDLLNECYVFCHNKTVTEVVEGIKTGLQSEGIGDSDNQIRINISGMRKDIIKQRPTFKSTKIFLPRVLHRYRNTWRKFIYEEDLLQSIDFDKISYRKKDTFAIDNIDHIPINHVKIDILGSGGPYISQKDKSMPLNTEIDFVHMVRRLSRIIPNPFESSRILEEVFSSLKSKNISLEQVYNNREALLGSIEMDIKEQIHQISEETFKQKLADGNICFKIFRDEVTLNWKMADEVSFLVSQDDKKLRDINDDDFQMRSF